MIKAEEDSLTVTDYEWTHQPEQKKVINLGL
jgi:hypothetical protein